MLAVGQVLVRGISGLSSWSQHCETRTVWRLSARLVWYYWAVACPINTMISYSWHCLQKTTHWGKQNRQTVLLQQLTHTDSHTHTQYLTWPNLFSVISDVFSVYESKTELSHFSLYQHFVTPEFCDQTASFMVDKLSLDLKPKDIQLFFNLLLLPVCSPSQRNHWVIKVSINKCILAALQYKHWGSKPTISVSCSKQGKCLKNQMKLPVSSVC